MSSTVTTQNIHPLLDRIYRYAGQGGAGLDSAFELAESYRALEYRTSYEQANALIRAHNGKAGVTGFLSGLGGFMTLPVTLPAGLGALYFIQIRMAMSLAELGGHSTTDDRVKGMVYASLLGQKVYPVLRSAGVKIGEKTAIRLIQGISGKTLVKINQAVGFRLVTKFGEKGVINLGKAVPAIGGLIGGSMDSWHTNHVGNCARDLFIEPG